MFKTPSHSHTERTRAVERGERTTRVHRWRRGGLRWGRLGGRRLQGGCGRRARRAASTRLGLLLLVAGGHLEQVVDDTVDVRVGVRVRVRVGVRV